MAALADCQEDQPLGRASASGCGGLQVFDRDRLDWVGEVEAEDSGVEVELSVEGGFDVLRDPEPVLLALERDISDWQPFLAERINDDLGLVGRHDLVFSPWNWMTGAVIRSTKYNGERSWYASARTQTGKPGDRRRPAEHSSGKATLGP